jgi:hypothetical protein
MVKKLWKKQYRRYEYFDITYLFEKQEVVVTTKSQVSTLNVHIPYDSIKKYIIREDYMFIVVSLSEVHIVDKHGFITGDASQLIQLFDSLGIKKGK